MTNYTIFQNAIEIANTSETSFLVENLAADTTYEFYITASDAASNTSIESTSIKANTEADNQQNNGTTIAQQGFESTADDTWVYSLNPIACNDNNNDVWDVVESISDINSASQNTNFFGVKDLQGNCGTAEGGVITLNTFDLNNYDDVTS